MFALASLSMHIIVFATITVDAYPNVALNKHTEQSSFPGTNPAWPSSNAVDGNTNGDMYAGSCINTGNGAGWHWLLVDLGAVHVVYDIAITNRDDCCSDQLKNITIELAVSHPSTYASFPEAIISSPERGLDLCTKTPIEAIPTPGPFNIKCRRPDILSGRYIRIVMKSTGVPMVLCEVQVFGQQIDMDDDGNINIAYNKTAKQFPPSVRVSGISAQNQAAARALDGKRLANIYHGNCANTEKQAGWHWWMVDLESVYIIDYIRLSNRAEISCCIDRLSNFAVEVSVENPENFVGFPRRTNASVCMTRDKPVPIPGRRKYFCDKPVEGRYIRIVRYAPKTLTICEFEAFGKLKVAEKPVEKPASKRQWTFELVNFKILPEHHIDMNDARRKATNCARERLAINDDSTILLYVLTELPDGTCRYFDTLINAQRDAPMNWYIYKLIDNFEKN